MTVSPESLTSSKSGAGLPSSTNPSSLKRAVGVVRVSRVGGRDGEQFVSPSEQAERIRTACERDGLTLVDTIQELDVSGGASLEKRHGLRRAVEMVEAGEVDVVVVAYLDRLVRSLTVQAEVVGRVEAAGGAIMAVDVGALSHDSAGSWLSGTMLGAVAEYARRVTAERTQDSKRRAVARGVPPFPNIPPGYRQLPNGQLELHPTEAPIVADAFRLRAEGATVMDVREHLRAHGIDRSFHGTQALLGSRLVLGELSFGKLHNATSHPALIDADTWGKVQRMKSTRGRRAKSDRLLARLGVLRCASCGSRLSVCTTRAQTFYRCPPVGDCTQRVAISADKAERTVAEAVQELLRGVEGTASTDTGIEAARTELERAEDALGAAVRAFDGFDDVDTVREKLTALRDQRDQARERLADLSAAVLPTIRLTADDWHQLTLEERRALIRATIASATVAPGRGDHRITIEPRTQ